ncbi:MAG TPA: ABC transporter substrate-binding protein [Xanthobacteraceae bacterium]
MVPGIERRKFVLGLTGAVVTWPLRSPRAEQTERVRRVGVVMGYAENDPNGQLQVAAFCQQLDKLGWVEGRNVRIDWRYAADDPGHIRTMGEELLQLSPDVMVANSNLVTTILQTVVRTIPLVFVSVSDPIGSGFVTDLARPNGNVTGFANYQPTMGSKWLELLRQIAPGVENVGVLLHPEPPNIGYLKSAEAAASSFRIKLECLAVNSGADIEVVLDTLAPEPTGLIVAPNAVTFANSDLIIALAARRSMPAIYPFAFYAKAGGLISYGFDAVAQFRQGAEYVDKLLRGAKPSDLPVQHPTKFDLVLNMKTAKMLGLEVPPSLLALTDDVIE